MITTVKEYAKLHQVSVSTARRRLNALANEGKAERKIRWEHPAPQPFLCQEPPPHQVIVYTIADQ